MPDGFAAYVTLTPMGEPSKRGILPQEIIGQLVDPNVPDGDIKPENFARNRAFVDFMHAVIKKHGPSIPGLISEAHRQGNGWVMILDRRTPTPSGAVPPEDVIGAFQVQDGQIIRDSYQGNPNHRILSQQGFFQLEPTLQQHLLDELAASVYQFIQAEPASRAGLIHALERMATSAPTELIDYYASGKSLICELDANPFSCEFWPRGELGTYNLEYQVPKCAPGYFGFATNGGGEMFAISPVGSVVGLPFIGMEASAATTVAPSWAAFVDLLRDAL